jgi:hypothetical protein
MSNGIDRTAPKNLVNILIAVAKQHDLDLTRTQARAIVGEFIDHNPQPDGEIPKTELDKQLYTVRKRERLIALLSDVCEDKQQAANIMIHILGAFQLDAESGLFTRDDFVELEPCAAKLFERNALIIGQNDPKFAGLCAMVLNQHQGGAALAILRENTLQHLHPMLQASINVISLSTPQAPIRVIERIKHDEAVILEIPNALDPFSIKQLTGLMDHIRKLISKKLLSTINDDVIRDFKKTNPLPLLLDYFEQYIPEGFGTVTAQSRRLGVFGLYRCLDGAILKTDRKQPFIEIAANSRNGLMLDTYSDDEYLVTHNAIKLIE